MDGLECVRRAIHFQGPDRIPHCLPDDGPNDIVSLGPPRPETGRATEWHEVETGCWRRYDEWGTLWGRFGPSGSGEVVEPVLADWARLDKTLRLLGSVPPLAPLADYRNQIQEDAGAHYFLGTLQYPSIYATGHDLRGLVPFLTDLYEHPSELGRLLDRLAESQIMCVDLFADRGVHGILAYDDWGMQDRTFISPRLWQRFFAPRYRAVWGHAHERGLDVWLHSCGYILPLLPLMMDCGLDVAQLDQQENMGLENLDRVAGGRLAFWCPADIQTVMALGTEAEIEAYVRRMIYYLGRHKGGLVSKAYSSPQDINHTPERIAAMCRAFRRWGVYPPAGDLV
jgi:uroporphyrinogen decarboxylase